MNRSTTSIALGRHRHRVICEELLRTQIVQYAGVSGDYSPLHTDERYAVNAGYPTVMAHGMFVMAATSRVLTDWVGVEWLTRFAVRFRAPAWPGDRLTAEVRVEALRPENAGTQADFRLCTTNQDGAEIIAGTATAWVIGGPDS